MDMDCEVRGDINRNHDGSYSIFINARLCAERQKEICMHELIHIYKEDFEKETADEIEWLAHQVITI